MYKYLVVSDIHHQVGKAQKIIDSNTFDKCVLLNDVFDSYGDNDFEAEDAAIWLKEKLHDSKFVVLQSNHVISYSHYFNQNTRCSGYRESKRKAIWKVLRREDFDQLKWYAFLEGILFTHAGVDKRIFYRRVENIEDFDVCEALDEMIPEANAKLMMGQDHVLYGAGYVRSGRQSVGGIIWNDFTQENDAVNDYIQIVGHTRTDKPFYYYKENGQRRRFDIDKFPYIINYKAYADLQLNIDTGLSHFALIENNTITVHES